MTQTTTAEKRKTTRTTFVMDDITKILVDFGAQYTNSTKTAFIRDAVRERAERLVRESKERTELLAEVVPTVLSETESIRFIQALERDFAPTQAMLDLNKKRHRDIIELV